MVRNVYGISESESKSREVKGISGTASQLVMIPDHALTTVLIRNRSLSLSESSQSRVVLFFTLVIHGKNPAS
jgi:hypothetical protein